MKECERVHIQSDLIIIRGNVGEGGPQWLENAMWRLLAIICLGFGIIDFFGFYLFDIDLTGVSWSPL